MSISKIFYFEFRGKGNKGRWLLSHEHAPFHNRQCAQDYADSLNKSVGNTNIYRVRAAVPVALGGKR